MLGTLRHFWKLIDSDSLRVTGVCNSYPSRVSLGRGVVTADGRERGLNASANLLQLYDAGGRAEVFECLTGFWRVAEELEYETTRAKAYIYYLSCEELSYTCKGHTLNMVYKKHLKYLFSHVSIYSRKSD